MNLFKRDFNLSVCPPSDPGNPISLILGPSTGDDGNVILVPYGEENTDDYINSFAASCDMSLIINQIMHGLRPDLAYRNPIYTDFSNLPRDPIELVNYISAKQRVFDSLSAEDKVAYNSDFVRFLSGVRSDSVSVPDSDSSEVDN